MIHIGKTRRNDGYSLILTIILLFTSVLLNSCSSSEGSKIVTDDPESAYLQAKARYDKGDYLDAIDDFNMIKLKFSGSKIIDKAVYYLGMSYYKREEYILGVYEFETIVKNYPSSSFTEDARYHLAMSYYKLSPKYSLDQTYTRYAITEFQNFIDLYPGSKYTPEAERKITEMENKLALKLLKSAELYYTMEKYRSSIVYYDDVLEMYFDSEYADDALYGKIQALISKKNYEAALKEIERFEKYFSSSPLLYKVKNLKSGLR
ncbi:MAG: outer membrane protein assembly factor BamD [Ignavibacteria bacterium]|nr:outer membrane protein assembly factor BamD [Ignavibacteria bacterium]